MRLNPNAPGTVGIEWRPVASGTIVWGASPANAVVVDSTATELVAAVETNIGTLGTGPSVSVCDVYDATGPAEPWAVGPAVTSVAVPHTDYYVEGTGLWTNNDGTTVNYWSRVDETNLTLDTSNYIATSQASLPYGLAWQMTGTWKDYTTGAAASLAGRRISQLRVRVTAANTSSTYDARVYAILRDGAEESTPGWQALPAGYHRKYLVYSWNTNPFTGRPWRTGDLDQFVTGAGHDYAFGIRGRAGSLGEQIRVYAVQIEIVTHAETRVATGSLPVDPSDDAGTRRFTFAIPATGVVTPWAKEAAKTYWLAFHTPGAATRVYQPTVDGDALDGVRGADLPVMSDGTPNPDAAWPPTLLTRVQNFALSLSGGGYSPDGQPYSHVFTAPVCQPTPVMQELSGLTVGGDAYQVASAVVRAPSSATPTAPLIWSVVDRTAADAVVAGPVETGLEALPPSDDGTGHTVQVQFATGFAPAAGHVYALVLASNTTATVPWQVYYLSGQDDHAAIGYGGTGDAATLGTTRHTDADLLATVGQPPAVLTGVAASTYTQPVGDGADGGCVVTSVETIAVSWGQSLLVPGQFGYYEVERDDGPAGYQTVARVADQTTPWFYDFEARRNTVAAYRVRQVRNDGAASDWSTIVSETATMTAGDLILTTNVAPGLTVAYNHDPKHDFEFQDAATVVTHPLFGRNYQVAFRPLEYRGDRFRRQVVVAFDNTVTATVGRAAFDPLIVLARAQVPYVAVLDPDGNRWCASVRVASGVRVEGGGRYSADVDVTEVTATPAAALATFTPGTPATGLYGDPGGTYGDGTYAA